MILKELKDKRSRDIVVLRSDSVCNLLRNIKGVLMVIHNNKLIYKTDNGGIMNASIGRINVELSASREDRTSELIEILNRNISPPTRLEESDIHIRTMFVLSDQVNSYGGCFDPDDHEAIAKLMIDSPVLVGHRKDKLPIGRTFHATLEKRGDENWVKAYFYWLKSSEGSNDLADNIDGGVYKECSIAFTYRRPECSICGADIRSCRHEPLTEQKENTSSSQCFYYYREIERVLETSLVYRGAVANTSMSGDLSDKNDSTLDTITDLGRFSNDSNFLVVPRYEGLRVRINGSTDNLRVERQDGKELSQNGLGDLAEQLVGMKYQGRGMLVGYRGKKRTDAKSLEAYLSGEKSEVNRVRLMLYPNDQIVGVLSQLDSSHDHIRVFPHRLVCRGEVEKAASEIMTKGGVEIWTGSLFGDGYNFKPGQSSQIIKEQISIVKENGKDKFILQVDTECTKRSYELTNFDHHLFEAGKKFVALQSNEPNQPAGLLFNKQVFSITDGENGAWRMSLDSQNEESLTLRPIRLNGKLQYLFYLKTA